MSRIVTSSFGSQVMKFDDLKELGTENAVKVRVAVYSSLCWFRLIVMDNLHNRLKSFTSARKSILY